MKRYSRKDNKEEITPEEQTGKKRRVWGEFMERNTSERAVETKWTRRQD